MKPGTVTVMVPSYNYGRYLTECVESAARQEHADVVVVDNGSTDDSPEIGERLARLHANVRFVRYERNEGIITSFTRCRAEIRGDYAVLLPADDCLAPGSLARSVAFLDAHPGVGLAYGPVTDFATLADVRFADYPATSSPAVIHAGAAWIDRLCHTIRNPIRTPEAVMRSSVFEAIGPYEPSCVYTSDLNNWLRIAARSDVAYLPGPLQAMFRQHESNEGKAYPHGTTVELEQFWQAFATFLERLGDHPRRADWTGVVRRSFAAEARYSATRAYVGLADGAAEADALLAFAEGLEPGGASSIDDIGWRIRRRLGPTASKYFPGFLPSALMHRLVKIRSERRRLRTGLG